METATKYPPIPADAPFLFDNQDKPFAGDTFMERDFLALRDKYGIKTVIETGTCYGSTALWFAEHFPVVISMEINPAFADIAFNRYAQVQPDLQAVEFVIWKGDSGAMMPKALEFVQEPPILCFLDAHFEKHCPLLDELKAIADSGIKPVIVVHDMYVPGRKDLGYDTWNGKRFTFEWLKPSLDRIYGRGGYSHWFNSEATGAKRGCLYVVPL